MAIIPAEGAQPPAFFVPLSNTEGLAIYDLLMQGCKLYYQRGKERLFDDPQVMLSHLIPDNRALCAPYHCDSVGVEAGSLPEGVGIVDLDNTSLALSIKEALVEEAGLSIEKTPSGGLHIWGRGLKGDIPINGFCRAGLRIEYFVCRRITIIGPGRSIIRWTPLSKLVGMPSPLMPAKGDQIPEIDGLIPFGRRWNSLYEQIQENSSLDKETLRFQARVLCKPPLEDNKERDLQAILDRRIEKRGEQELDERESLEESVSKSLVQALADRWIYRLPDREWYKYANGHWATHDGACYEIMNEIEDTLMEIRGKETPINRKRLGTLQFRKLMEECLKQRLYKTPKPLKGVHFTNGLLVVEGCERRLRSTEPGLWSFNQCGIMLDIDVQLTPAHKSFLIGLTDGDRLKLNVLRAYLRLLFTHDSSEQFFLYLWGPGATGKSTFVQLLEYIIGDAACALDILRLTNRFEMKVVQDKLLITLPDIPLKVNDAQCSMIKKLVTGDKIVIEIKNGSIYVLSIVALLLVTSNTRWCVQDRTSGFRRRVLYVLTPKAAVQRDPFLLNKLKVDASGLINWALDMPAERARIGQSVEAINELSGGGVDSSGVMEWLFAMVLYNPASEMPLGAKKIPMPGGLYESYVIFAESNGIEPASYCSFGDLLEDSVRSLGYSDIVTKRRTQGRVVVGVSLAHGKRFKRTQRSEAVKYLMEAEPWEGFDIDRAAFEKSNRAGGRDDEEDEADHVDYVNHVDSYELARKPEKKESPKEKRTKKDGKPTNYVNNVDHVDFLPLGGKTERKRIAREEGKKEDGQPPAGVTLLGPPKKPKRIISALCNLISQKVGNLTRKEEEKTEEFLSKHPRLIQELSEAQEDWTEERLVEEANSMVKSDQNRKETVEQLYAALEAKSIPHLELPPKLERSTTMGGVVYPLAQRMEEGLDRLRTHAGFYSELIDTLNDGAQELIDTSYMLFRLFRRQGSTYYNRSCPVKRLFASSYLGQRSYPRIVPYTTEGSGTIACLRRDCKRVIKDLAGKHLLPDSVVMDEIDMVACHTGIYVGLTGCVAAPHTWEAYQTGKFWPHILNRWGEDIPKKLLKTILYSGLNGASMKGGGSIRTKVKDFFGDGRNGDMEQCLQKVLRHPILVELAQFQLALGRREKIYIPSRYRPYYGQAEEEQSGKRGGSRFQEGLLSSRALASHEVVLLAYLVDCISRNTLGVPLSLENDGLLFLTRSCSRDRAFVQLNSFLQSCSLDFLGVKIPLERKE